MPTLSLYFDKDFPDPRWAKITYALEIPGGKTGEFILGRSPIAHLTFDIKSMSVRHAVIAYSYARNLWTIDDLGSTNGILLNGLPVKPKNPQPLNIGDKFWLGPEAKIYCVENEQDTTTPDELGPATIASTTPLAVVPPPPPPPPPEPEPPPSRTWQDSLYLWAQWGISASTVPGKIYRLFVLAIAAVFVVVLIDRILK